MGRLTSSSRSGLDEGRRAARCGRTSDGGAGGRGCTRQSAQLAARRPRRQGRRRGRLPVVPVPALGEHFAAGGGTDGHAEGTTVRCRARDGAERRRCGVGGHDRPARAIPHLDQRSGLAAGCTHGRARRWRRAGNRYEGIIRRTGYVRVRHLAPTCAVPLLSNDAPGLRRIVQFSSGRGAEGRTRTTHAVHIVGDRRFVDWIVPLPCAGGGTTNLTSGEVAAGDIDDHTDGSAEAFRYTGNAAQSRFVMPVRVLDEGPGAMFPHRDRHARVEGSDRDA